MNTEKMHNPKIQFAEELPVFYSQGEYEEVKGLPEEYENGLLKRLVSDSLEECDIEWYRWDKNIAPLNECIQIDVDAFNLGSDCIAKANINCFNTLGDSDYTFIAFPACIRGKDYLAEICYFELEKDFLSFEMLSKTEKFDIKGTKLSLMIPFAAKYDEKEVLKMAEEGMVFSSPQCADWLPKMEIYVWEKDGDFDHFREYISNHFDLRKTVKEKIKLADASVYPGMKLDYYTDKTDTSCSNLEWILDLGEKYLSIRFEYIRDFEYEKIVALGILSSLKSE